MKAIEILAELCQRLRWVGQHPDVELPHEHKRIAELLEMGKDDEDVAHVRTVLDVVPGAESIGAALDQAVRAYKSRRDKPDELHPVRRKLSDEESNWPPVDTTQANVDIKAAPRREE